MDKVFYIWVKDWMIYGNIVERHGEREHPCLNKGSAQYLNPTESEGATEKSPEKPTSPVSRSTPSMS